MAFAKANTRAKFDETVDVAVRLGVDPRKADQMVRGTVNLPNGTGKTARVLVFATGERAEAAKAAGADEVGSDELIDKVSKGYLDFDAVVATPDMMGKVGRLGRILGPRGLMPNPKTGTVTMDVAKAVSDIKGGKIEFRVDRHANLHFIIGKASFSTEQLSQNYFAALDEIIRLKPSAAKGRYLRKITLSTTMGPGIPVDTNKTRPELRVTQNPVRTGEFGCSRAGAELVGGHRRLPGIRRVVGPPVSRRQARRRSGGVDRDPADHQASAVPAGSGRPTRWPLPAMCLLYNGFRCSWSSRSSPAASESPP